MEICDMEETFVTIVRVCITFFSLLIFTRFLGKQQIGNLTFFDYITGITIGSIAANVATDLSSKAWIHWIGLLTFVIITFLFQVLTLKIHYFSKIVASEPTVVIQNGKILENNLRKLRIKCDELFMLLRQKGIFDITKVQYGILEGNGHLSVMLVANEEPIKLKDMYPSNEKLDLPTTIVLNGAEIDLNLKGIGKDKEWLMQELKNRGISSIEDVSLAMILPNGRLYVDCKSDQIDKTNLDFDGQV
jgi:uncharacterized membrane protein YcaP (DUF421 family)